MSLQARLFPAEWRHGSGVTARWASYGSVIRGVNQLLPPGMGETKTSACKLTFEPFREQVYGTPYRIPVTGIYFKIAFYVICCLCNDTVNIDCM
jgi:hypothetical protein